MPKKILVVEDDSDTVEIIKKHLETNNYTVLTALDGLDGLHKARKEKPDLIILDLMLPKLDGYKICRMLKFDENYKDIPIIMCSGRTLKGDKDLGLEVGADAYLTKPFELKMLLDQVCALLPKSS
jgi:DNA-binding response OmpR family regulator